MAQPLQRALERYQGNYNTLFDSGQILQKDAKKGWVVARSRISSKDRAEFFGHLVTALSLESLEGVPNPVGLTQRMNSCIQKPPIPKALPDSILFKSSCKIFGFLSNFFPSLISYNQRLFRSSEHLYQWRVVVALDPEESANHFEQLLGLSPLEARKYSHGQQASVEGAITDGGKLEIMAEVVLLKFSQNLPLREALVATYPTPLVENTESSFWGGEVNHMGKILETVREYFIPTK